MLSAVVTIDGYNPISLAWNHIFQWPGLDLLLESHLWLIFSTFPMFRHNQNAYGPGSSDISRCLLFLHLKKIVSVNIDLSLLL